MVTDREPTATLMDNLLGIKVFKQQTFDTEIILLLLTHSTQINEQHSYTG